MDPQPSADLNKKPEDSTSVNYFNLKPNASGLIMVPKKLSKYITRMYVVDMHQPSTSVLNPESPKPTSPIRRMSDDQNLENMCVSPVHKSTNTPHCTTPKSSYTSRIPVSIQRKANDEEIARALEANQIKPKVFDIIQEELDATEEEPKPGFSSDEDEDEIEESTVMDIRFFYKQFQTFYETMRSLNPSLYDTFGMQTEYDRLLKELAGFLGELCYFREKQE